MKKILFTILFLTSLTALSAQLQDSFLLVGSAGTFSALTDSTFRGTVTFQSDQFGSGYLPTGIQVNYKLIDAKGDIFTVTVVNSSNFTTANIDVEEDDADRTAPAGIVMVFKVLDSGLYPLPPVNSTGASPIMQARILTDNAINGSSSISTSDISFDSDREILRMWQVGDNVGGSTLEDFMEYIYFTAPTISMAISPSTTVYENGDSTQIIGTATTTNSGGATLSNGSFVVSWSGGSESKSYGAATSAKDTIQFAPIQGSSTNYNRTQYSFSASQDWTFGSDLGTANSNTRTVLGVYPVLYGVSATDYSASGNIYGAAGFSKLVQTEGNKSVTFTGTGFLYYAVPTTWGDTSMSVIYDHNGFDVTSSFTVYDVTVSSSGLTNNWSGVSYKLYKLNSSTTASGFTYQFNR